MVVGLVGERLDLWVILQSLEQLLLRELVDLSRVGLLGLGLVISLLGANDVGNQLLLFGKQLVVTNVQSFSRLLHLPINHLLPPLEVAGIMCNSRRPLASRTGHARSGALKRG